MNLPLDSPAALLVLYCLLALVAALVGGVMPTLVKLTHTRLQVADYFLCIAGADLLPKLQFHAHDRVKLSLALLAGVAVASLIVRFGHAHPMSAADLRPTPLMRPFGPAMRGNGAIGGNIVTGPAW
jgi:hypothetical protein